MSYDAFEPIGFGKEIFKQRYAIHPEETWDDACRRIASFIASAERNGKRLEWEERFYRELVSNRFIPGGRIMYGAGRAKAALINCFHKNSPVVTERGVLPITEVEIGDRVLTHDGTFQKVVNKFDQGVRESLLNITIDRMPKNSLQVTPEHKIMTKRGWVEAQNLTKDDFVSIAGYKDSFEVPTEINVKDYITLDYDLEDVEGMLHKLNVASGTTKFSNESGRSKYSQQIVPIKSSIPVNEDLFKLLGYYISEGCAAKTSPVVLFTFSKKETGYVEEVVSLCGSLFGVEAVVRDYKSWVQVVISSNLLNNFLTNFIGSSFDSKILPWWILNCPEEWRLTLLAYACRGDSHTDKKTGSTNLVMCNPHVMQQLFFIAQELGLAYSFKTLYKKEERHSTPYGLYISKVGYRDNIFSQFLDKLGHDVVYHDDPYWRKVLSVEEVPYNDVVWDISVDKNHSLQINGIVASNCFVIGSDDIDSREGWAKNLGDMLIISGLGGGVGINFCMSPESRVLTQDLKWVRIDSLKPQDKLIGLDEETDGSKGRHLRSSTVLACSPTKLPSVSIKTEKGEMLVSETHPILARKIRKNYKKSGQGFNWVMAKDLTSDYELAFATEPWEIEKKDELLWLGGLLDGEGCLSQRTRRNRVGGGIYNAQLSIGQNIGPVFDGIGKVLDRMGVKYGVYKNSNNSCYQYVIGSKWDAMRVLSSCPTIRLSELKNSVWEGAKICGKEANHVRVQSVEFVGEQELIAIQTSTKTFIAEGFFQHNSDIRPRGTKIHGTGGEATGAVSFMELINNIGEVIKGGGGRRSALMECLNIDHPDIIEFIDKKFVHIDLDLNNSEEVVSFVRKNLQLFDSEVLGLIKEVCAPDAPQQAKQMLSSMVKVFLEKNLRNANVSVVFNDDPEKFFEKVRNKEMHQLKWKGQVISEVRADKLWDKIITNALAGGEPGVLNMYLANKASNISNVGPLVSTNPCITDDNWIHTLEGPRQVKDLIGKKFTALIDGKPFDSTDEGFFYKGEKEVVLVTLDNGIELKCTPDHKILSVSEDGTEKMIPVSEIGIGGTVKLQNQRGSEWSGKGSFEEGWLLGSLIGDGTFGSSNSIEESVDYAKLTYWGEEKEAMYQQAVGYVTSNYGDYNGRFAKSSTENSYNKNLSLQSAPLMRFALGFGITRNNKRITETFEKEASSEAYKGLLRGLFDADGSVQGDSISGHTIRLSSSDLRNLKGAHRLLGRLGVMSKIYPNRRKERMKLMPDGKGGMKEYPCKAQHEIIISKGNIVLFRDIVGFSEPAKVTKLDSIISSRKKSFKIEKFVSKIKEIVSIGIEKVYDCTIPGPHMFDANQCGVSNCGEIAMTPHEVCDLAHIVLPRFIRDNGQVDWASLADTITAGIRFLDNVLDVTTYPTEEIKVKATNTRRLGLGITGLHDALLLMGLKYSSEEGRDTAAKIMKFIKNKSYEESVFLAAERGVYGFYDHEAIKQSATYRSLKPSVRHQIDERGLRNCALNTIAPCGCQKPDTMVLTDQGLLELGELGDSSGETWQKLDNIQAVQETSRQDATQFFVNGVAKTKIITLSSGIELEGTYNHRYRVLDSDGSYVWKRVDELKNGDKIVVRMDGYSKLENQKLENILEDLHGNTKVIKFPDEVTKEFAEFIGIYFADGSNHDKGIRIACDASKNTHMRVIELSRELFDIEPIIEEVRNCIYVCLNSQMLLKLLAINGLLKGKSYEVSIPKNIRTSSRGSLWAFIHGYYLGDGHIEGSSFRTWDTVSKKMCQQLLVALRSLGVYAKSRILPKDDEHLGTRDVYRIREYSMFSLGKEDAIRYVSRDLQEDYRNIKNIGEFLAIDEVDSIVDSVSMTLDIEVPETHTYLSNSVVSHNTNSIVSGVSSSAEPIMGPAYERMWWVGDEKNSEVVIHPLFEQFVIEGKDVSHFEYAEEIDPKDHLRMQAALQEHIDNAISKTIAIPSTYSKKQFSEDLMEFMPILKGITVYPIGSRGESPIKPLSIEKAIKVVKERIGRVGTSQEQENQDCPNGVCSLG